ncbi:N amino acid transport system protein [Porphyridium purpureum]|uniref:N amino acid transport system protein n=1 Tax=Porphyridium purpureum TaxID=35688 RepID=A0A5J4Z844_PORPP|nr:N amino acid transport system protein [Porphyridium purpureum]|eukprot:POR6458..scf295_1
MEAPRQRLASTSGAGVEREIAGSPARSADTFKTSKGKGHEYSRVSTNPELDDSDFEAHARICSQVDENEPGRRLDQTAVKDEREGISWIFATALIIAGTVSLGVLAMGSNFAVLGYLVGNILVIGLGIVATYTGYLLHEFYNATCMDHKVESYGDAMTICFGKGWGIFVQAEQCLLLFLFVAATCRSAGDAIFELAQGKVCFTVMALVGTILGALLSYPLRMRGVSVLSAISFACIVMSMIFNIVGVSATRYSLREDEQPSFLPPSGTSFSEGLSACTTIIFAYAGHLVFFEFMSSMKNPEHFATRALVAAQGFAVAAYSVVGSVIYCYTGTLAMSPSLLDIPASSGWAISGWVFLLPNVLIGGVIDANVFTHQFLRAIGKIAFWDQALGSVDARHPDQDDDEEANEPDTDQEAEVVVADQEHEKIEKSEESMTVSWQFRVYWIGSVFLVWLLAYVISQLIPTFNGLLGVISSLFSTQFTYMLPSVFWLASARRADKLRERWFLTLLNGVLVILSVTVMVAGTYVNIASFSTGSNGIFSCNVA